jgi:hypothetical protein
MARLRFLLSTHRPGVLYTEAASPLEALDIVQDFLNYEGHAGDKIVIEILDDAPARIL